ncbi:hypothetical protein PRIPAC_73008 [Pristionchus pacificus]|uniref:Uncharacterized protein n=1 Tax=Pristionchus pacificus TaxID=54126 RepID=A0A2A6BFE1_PRIPA|nr:hypothetical protein PRIPAC_73008 [Pristionchus pacificus]|eukprot:PDM64604.1 hypothetical protein PRIPAC_52860 [Pristionchus pacificus]
MPLLSSLGISGGRGGSLPRIALAARDASMTSTASSRRQLRQGRRHLHWIPDEEADRRVKGGISWSILWWSPILLVVTHSLLVAGGGHPLSGGHPLCWWSPILALLCASPLGSSPLHPCTALLEAIGNGSDRSIGLVSHDWLD